MSENQRITLKFLVMFFFIIMQNKKMCVVDFISKYLYKRIFISIEVFGCLQVFVPSHHELALFHLPFDSGARATALHCFKRKSFDLSLSDHFY